LDTLIEILLHSLPHNGAAGHPWFFDPIKLQVPKKWELFQGGGNRVSATDNSLLGTIFQKIKHLHLDSCGIAPACGQIRKDWAIRSVVAGAGCDQVRQGLPHAL
jgi:hypothetical protein